MASNLIFEGNVEVYLQGKDALLPQGRITQNISYFIGSQQSELTLKDYRSRQIQAAQHILSGKNGFEFADVFNEPAWVKVFTNTDQSTLEIEMHEATETNNHKILWLGVIDNNEMSVQPIAWEFLHPIEKNRIAFAAIVNKP
jgi:hypothetical protein